LASPNGLNPPAHSERPPSAALSRVCTALEHGVVHHRIVHRLVVGNEPVEAPAVGNVTLDPAEVLLDLVVLVPALVRHADIPRAPPERQCRPGSDRAGNAVGDECPRRQNSAQIGRNERVSHRNGSQGAELGQTAAAVGAGGQIDEHELAVERQPGGQFVVGLEERRLAVEAVDVIDLLADRHADVAADHRIAL
jgi:hypothetical protein